MINCDVEHMWLMVENDKVLNLMETNPRQNDKVLNLMKTEDTQLKSNKSLAAWIRYMPQGRH